MLLIPPLRWDMRIFVIMSWKADLGSVWPFKLSVKDSVDLVSQHFKFEMLNAHISLSRTVAVMTTAVFLSA